MSRRFEHSVQTLRIPYQQTPFIGREREIAEVLDLLDNPACRLLTVLGPGGSGKTRLAIQCATLREESFPDGAYFGSLASLSSADDILGELALVLNLQLHSSIDPKQQILSWLRQKRMLLILDNLEHMLSGVQLIAELLFIALHIKVLVTSREVLNLREEWVWNVPGMDYPTGEPETQIDSYSAIRLFVERARQAGGNFSLANEQAAVIHICRLTEGMPLAIELAASWVKVLSCEQIAVEMQHSMDFLVTTMRNLPTRHQSMRAAFHHSWRLLTEEERKVFENLSVFRGGFSRQAAEQVAGASLFILVALADKSLIRKLPAERYNVHEMLRQYGEEQLKESDSSNVVADAHCRYYAHFILERVEDLQGRRQRAALDEIEADFENVRTAWNWAVTSKQSDQLDIALEGLQRFLIRLSHYRVTRCLDSPSLPGGEGVRG